ncbi:N-myristoyl transferase [Russula earlei]|uniref:N-myristoyl transferase n=1 Tax=Russula earlei TaxID=71964 RepID=A0ACC0U987_9AGAM|nr:N-myristoyl transferase [Russula earlei]
MATKGKASQDTESPATQPTPEAEPGAGDESGSDSDAQAEEVPAAAPSESGPSRPSSKKRKKRSKVARALSALKGDSVPQAVVDQVVAKVKEEHGESSAAADEETVREVLRQLKLKDVAEGKAGLGGKNRKETGDHKFWATQPVPHYDDVNPEEDGYIEPPKTREEVRQDPFPLPKDFEWTFIDVVDTAQLKEVYELLSANYVEDEQAAFRFRYTAEFLEWALMPPGWQREWHLGVRVSSNKKLVAFISGVPINLRVREKDLRAVEINYLCVHKKLRSKRLTPVLIKEITRQCHFKGIFQAIYTAGVVIPTPISTCRYYHRTLNVPKLVDAKFTYVPRNMTIARMIRQYKVPSNPSLSRAGLREMEEKDVAAVAELFKRYMGRFDMIPLMDEEDVRHQFLSGRGKGEKSAGRRPGQVVWTYVVEAREMNPESHAITDFFSFYALPSTIVSNPRHNLLEAAYLYHYASDTAFVEKSDELGLLKRRLTELIGDAIVVADQAKFDVFNALTLMDNPPILARSEVRIRRRPAELLFVQLALQSACWCELDRGKSCRQRRRCGHALGITFAPTK